MHSTLRRAEAPGTCASATGESSCAPVVGDDVPLVAPRERNRVAVVVVLAPSGKIRK